MTPQERKAQDMRTDPWGNLESPFLEAELFTEESKDDWEPRLAALEAESPFLNVLSPILAAFGEPEELAADDSPACAAPIQEAETLLYLEEEVGEFYDREEDFWTDEEDSREIVPLLEEVANEWRGEEEALYAEEETIPSEEEPLISEEVLRELEEGPPPTPDLRSRIVDVAKREWEAWKKGNLSETNSGALPLLLNYWLNYRPGSTNHKTANQMIQNRVAWSAVFISFVMQEAGAGQSFAYAPLHTNYIAAAKKAAENHDMTKFCAYPISSVKPEVGDLVCRDRAPGKGSPCAGTTLANVDKGGISHCDIVVEVQPRHIVILGGNTAQTYPDRGMMQDTVGQRRIRLDAQGLVIPAQSQGACQYFAILKPPGSNFVPTAPTGASMSESISGATKPTAELVRFAQRILNVAEGESLDVDGALGPLTRGALERFRKKYNLGADSVLDDKTQLALAQRALEELSRKTMFEKGKRDAATDQALSEFKEQRGLSVEPVLDAPTRAALAKAQT